MFKKAIHDYVSMNGFFYGIDNMFITLNGKKEELKNEMTIALFLKSKGMDLDKVIVEVNCKIVKKNNWSSTKLNENDSIEIVSFVGGG